ncbi:MAG: hypothetical protein SF339_13590 [Blastocatellia bacterium]|nr:hypothetical protein [Blastocatellia bacterium]
MTHSAKASGSMARMLSDLVVVHRRRLSGRPLEGLAAGVRWETCLRQVAFLHRAEHARAGAGAAGDEIYCGHEAYRFVLEVICGLHSPMVGETEVMGQFREFSRRAEFPNTSWGAFLRRFAGEALTDARRVRSGHLRGVGSQSYGSLARRYLRRLPGVVFLGAGQLAKEMLPWLAGEAEVTVVNRNPRSAEALRQAHPQIRLVGLEAPAPCAAREAGLIVAAPLRATEIEAWVIRQPARFVRTLDLRGESGADPVDLPGEVLDLGGFFRLLDEERHRARGAARDAGQEIKRLAERRLRQMECRPFGWEDLCA